MFSTRYIAPLLVGLFLITGCGGGGNPAAPPDGWETTDTRWWKQGVDTSQVFPNLDSLTTMGIIDEKVSLTGGEEVTREQFEVAIKRSLIPLYRNNPTIVDSLFEKYAAPKLKKADLSGSVVNEKGQLKSKLRNKYQKMAYKAISAHFREPQRTQAPEIRWPDSLRAEKYTGIVKLQVHLSPQGTGDKAIAKPDAIKIRSGPHPTLSKIAAKATTKARWEPAYLLKDSTWTPVESWVRFDVPFQMR
ncbi:MAG: hypothetical protein ABEK84_09525 [Salinibacter sp.]